MTAMLASADDIRELAEVLASYKVRLVSALQYMSF